jgi:CheY-like chemotaxis protein
MSTLIILAVDDSPSMREMLAAVLRDSGYQVVEAEDGVKALEVAKSRAVDVVLTDQNMPNMDGLSLVKNLRRPSRVQGHADHDAHDRVLARDEAEGARRGRDRLDGEAVRPGQARAHAEGPHRHEAPGVLTMALDLSRFAKAFYEEAQDHLSAMETLLVAIDAGRGDEESLNALFRAAHSIKGGAAAFGHTPPRGIHARPRDHPRPRAQARSGAPQAMVDVILEAGDVMPPTWSRSTPARRPMRPPWNTSGMRLVDVSAAGGEAIAIAARRRPRPWRIATTIGWVPMKTTRTSDSSQRSPRPKSHRRSQARTSRRKCTLRRPSRTRPQSA